MIVVIDSTDKERLFMAKEELWRMLAHEDLAKAAVLIYANKQDVKGSLSAAEISKQLDLTSIKEHQWTIQGCCALTGEGYVSYHPLEDSRRYHLPKKKKKKWFSLSGKFA
mgnify:CR=1 FL=1